MKYELFAVEIMVNSNPATYELTRRTDEDGFGSPLVWPDRAGAEKFIQQIAEECGGPDACPDAQVVVLSGGTDSENESAEPFYGEVATPGLELLADLENPDL